MLERQIESADLKLQTLTTETQLALDAAREARRTYALKVRTSHKLEQACRQEAQRAMRVESARVEQRADDDFTTRWQHESVHRSAA
ncbi:MAG: hypothetical protein H0U56_12085 [Methylibium sp.]|nr:hypothetical protein [Methylibium sp.]